MADETAQRDDNYVTVIQGVSSVDEKSTTNIYVNPDTAGDGTGIHGVIVSLE